MPTTFDWTDVAVGWDTHRHFVETMKRDLTETLLAGLALRPGERVLELGAGTGELALRLAELVGPTGAVHATDVAPGMVALVRERASGRPEITSGRVDAADTGLPSGAFDAVVFRMGLMLLPEPARAVAECRRVLRSGGRVAVAVWGGMDRNPWLVALGMAAMIHGVLGDLSPTGPGGPFSLASAEELEKLFVGAGFDEVEVRPVPIAARFASAEDHFEKAAALAGPLSGAIAAAPAETVERIRETAAEVIAPYRTDDGYVVPGEALLAVARAGDAASST